MINCFKTETLQLKLNLKLFTLITVVQDAVVDYDGH